MNDMSSFAGGRNIAMKVPPHQWDATVRFYRDVVGLDELDHEPTDPPSVGVRFGGNQGWIDRADRISDAAVWPELSVQDVTRAADHLSAAKIVRRDEIEPLAEGFTDSGSPIQLGSSTWSADPTRPAIEPGLIARVPARPAQRRRFPARQPSIGSRRLLWREKECAGVVVALRVARYRCLGG